MENKPTTIYLPANIKQQLLDAAQSNGFDIGRGRNSGLPKFIAAMIKEYAHPALNSSSMPLLVQTLTPELRNTLLKVSQMDRAQQQRASQVLELVFSTWLGQSDKEHYDNQSKS